MADRYPSVIECNLEIVYRRGPRDKVGDGADIHVRRVRSARGIRSAEPSSQGRGLHTEKVIQWLDGRTQTLQTLYTNQRRASLNRRVRFRMASQAGQTSVLLPAKALNMPVEFQLPGC